MIPPPKDGDELPDMVLLLKLTLETSLAKIPPPKDDAELPDKVLLLKLIAETKA